jgi:hypothetical protein
VPELPLPALIGVYRRFQPSAYGDAEGILNRR